MYLCTASYRITSRFLLCFCAQLKHQSTIQPSKCTDIPLHILRPIAFITSPGATFVPNTNSLRYCDKDDDDDDADAHNCNIAKNIIYSATLTYTPSWYLNHFIHLTHSHWCMQVCYCMHTLLLSLTIL